jgi:Bestrophin, RFP-TM, chloride channel
MRFTAVFLTAIIGTTQAFVAPSTRVPVSTSSTQVYNTGPSSTGFDSFKNVRVAQDIPDGEAQRQFRRTVYSHDDWKKHRSQDRFFFYLAAVFKSGVYKNLAREVALTTFIATVVCIYNGLVGGFVGLDGVLQDPILSAPFLVKIGLPLTPFTLASSSLGLLLGEFLAVQYTGRSGSLLHEGNIGQGILFLQFDVSIAGCSCVDPS